MLLTVLCELEGQVALLTWHLRASRMTPRQHAIYTHGLVKRQPSKGIEARIDSLIQEIRHARQDYEAG